MEVKREHRGKHILPAGKVNIGQSSGNKDFQILPNLSLLWVRLLSSGLNMLYLDAISFRVAFSSNSSKITFDLSSGENCLEFFTQCQLPVKFKQTSRKKA